MNLFKSKHQKLLDEKAKIESLYTKVSEIEPVSDIDQEVKDTQLATLTNNWVTLAKLLDQYQPKFIETAPATFENMVGGMRRTAVLHKPIHEEMNVLDISLGEQHILPKFKTYTAWENTTKNLKEKARTVLTKVIEQKKLAEVKMYCEKYEENRDIIEDFILGDNINNITSRVIFIHTNFYPLAHLHTKLQANSSFIGKKSNILVHVDTESIHISEAIVLCDKLNTYYYDFLIKETSKGEVHARSYDIYS